MSLFQKRHYEWLARWCEDLPRSIDITTRQLIVADLALELDRSQDNFDYNRFCRACGVTDPRQGATP